MEEVESAKSVTTLTVTLPQRATFVVKKIQSGNKTEFECDICQESFSTLASIKVHYSAKHTDPKLRCEFCGLRSFPDDVTFQLHVSTFHYGNEDEDADGESPNPLKCRVCGKTPKDKKALWRHIRESHRTEQYPCDVCSFVFTRPENLKVHVMTVHLSAEEQELRRKWKCKECDKTFKLKSSMRQHVQIAHRQCEMARCNLCQRDFKGDKVLARHMAWVHEKRNLDKYECHLCYFKFRNTSHLKRHLNSNFHNPVPGKRGCRRRVAGQEQEEILNGGRGRKQNTESPTSEDSTSRTVLGRKCKMVATQRISKFVSEDSEDEEVGATRKPRRLPTIARKSASSPSVSESITLEYCGKIPESDGFILKDVIKIEEPYSYVPEQVEVESSYSPWDFCAIESTSVKIEITSSPRNNSPVIWRNHLDENSDEDGPSSSNCTSREIKMETDAEIKHFCVYCEQGFSSLEAVETHEKPCGEFQRSRKSWGCTRCDKIFQTCHALKMHMTRHSDERRFSCPLCPAKFKSPNALKGHHSVIHEGKESAWSKWNKIDHSVPCDKCGKVLSCPKNLRRHQQEMHSTSELDKKPHKCHLCSNRYKRIGELKNHVRLDHEQKVGFECTLCSVWFNRQRKLDDHFKRKRHLNRLKKGKKKRQGRHPGGCNILIRNLPETEESDAITKKVMQLLLPKALENLRVIVAKARVGPIGRTRAKKKLIRPLRVILPSVYYRNVALRNVSKLEKEEAFKHLSVTKDIRSKDVGVKDGQLLRVRY